MPPTTTIGPPRPSLTPDETRAVIRLVDEATRADGCPPLSEAFQLSVRSSGPEPGVTHLLGYAADGHLVGYAQSRAGRADDPPAAELVVAPGRRRTGVGTALLGALPQGSRVWSHGTGEAAEVAAAFAWALGLQTVRVLHLMGRPLRSGDRWPPPQLGERYAVRTFEPGRDEEAWLALNAAAFAHHPEQGSLALDDLRQRMAQPWWDPAGLILVVDADDPDRLAASHWTKVDPPDGDVGEVYVVAVDPGRQGEGLGRAVTVLGLDHLAALGLDRVVLYVDEANVAAVRTYRGLGFTDLEVHRQYRRPVTPFGSR